MHSGTGVVLCGLVWCLVVQSNTGVVRSGTGVALCSTKWYPSSTEEWYIVVHSDTGLALWSSEKY